MRKKILNYNFLLLSLIYCFFIMAPIIKAQNSYNWENSLNKVVEQTEYKQDIGEAGEKERGIVIIIAEIIKDILSLLALVFVVLAVYAGYLWMTAGGNDEQVSKAKIIIRDVIIGLIITLSAYAVAYYTLDKLIKAAGKAQEHRTGLYIDD
ncbi:MAG: hypothetical protein V1891_03035 [bacterium]